MRLLALGARQPLRPGLALRCRGTLLRAAGPGDHMRQVRRARGSWGQVGAQARSRPRRAALTHAALTHTALTTQADFPVRRDV